MKQGSFGKKDDLNVESKAVAPDVSPRKTVAQVAIVNKAIDHFCKMARDRAAKTKALLRDSGLPRTEPGTLRVHDTNLNEVLARRKASAQEASPQQGGVLNMDPMAGALVVAMDYFVRLSLLEITAQVKMVVVKSNDTEDSFRVRFQGTPGGNVLFALISLKSWFMKRLGRTWVKLSQVVANFLIWHERGHEIVRKREKAWDCALAVYEDGIAFHM